MTYIRRYMLLNGMKLSLGIKLKYLLAAYDCHAMLPDGIVCNVARWHCLDIPK